MQREPKIRRVDFYPDDFLVGARLLSDVECGIYWRACSLIYSHGGPILIDELRRWCTSRKRDFDGALNRLFNDRKLTKEGPSISQARAMHELNRSQARTKAWRENGAKGGRPNGLEKAGGFPEKNQASNNQHPTSNKEEEELPPLVPPSRKRATRLPEGWQPNDEERAFAFEQGLDWRETAAQFCDYWQAKGSNATKLDWHKTWRNWCRNERKAKRPEKLSPASKMLIGGYRAIERRMAAEKASRNTHDDDNSPFPLLDARRND